MPIYYVLVESEFIHGSGGILVFRIIKSFETTTDEALADNDGTFAIAYNEAWKSGHSPQWQIYHREPDNPFQDWKQYA